VSRHLLSVLRDSGARNVHGNLLGPPVYSANLNNGSTAVGAVQHAHGISALAYGSACRGQIEPRYMRCVAREAALLWCQRLGTSVLGTPSTPDAHPIHSDEQLRRRSGPRQHDASAPRWTAGRAPARSAPRGPRMPGASPRSSGGDRQLAGFVSATTSPPPSGPSPMAAAIRPATAVAAALTGSEAR
jgi:hypothetical protein